jgi:CHAT domain-containing protein
MKPLGLCSVFLLGGAASVLGALWPISSFTGRLFTQIFYKYFLKHVDRAELGPVVNLAKALQHNCLEIKKRKDSSTPYHWAPFVLYGAWFCRRKPGTW